MRRLLSSSPTALVRPRLAGVAMLVAGWLCSGFGSLGQGTAFSYQGRLLDQGSPAGGLYDFRASLFVSGSNSANLVAGPVTNAATPVSNGLFTLALDFGAGAFAPPGRWLQIEVRTNGGSAFVALTPRQPVLASPYSLVSASAESLAGPLPATQLTGTLSPAQMPASALTNGAAGVVLSGAFTGDGSGLTSTYSYTNLGARLAFPSNGIGSTVYVVSGATGSYWNSNVKKVDFAGANGTYVWAGPNSTAAPAIACTGVFTNSLNNGWFIGFGWSGVPNDNGSWIIFTTDNWVPQAPGAWNAVLYGNPATIYLLEMNTSQWWNYVGDGLPWDPSEVTLTAPATNEVTVVSTPSANPLTSLLHFPVIGPAMTSVYRSGQTVPGVPDAAYHGILNLTNGAGIVREIKVNLTYPDLPLTWQNSTYLQIFPDCGAATFKTGRSNYMTFNALIGTLAGNSYYPTNGPPQSYDTRYVGVQYVTTNQLYPGATGSEMVVLLKTPCLFSNGIYICLVSTNGGEIGPRGEFLFSTAHYSLAPAGVLTQPFANWRLRSRLCQGNYGPPSLTGATDWNHVVPTLLDASGPGVLLGLWGSASPATGVMEGGFTIWCDGQTTAWNGDGEDTFLDPWEFISGGNVRNFDFGTPNFSSGQYVEFYRQWQTGAVFWNVSAKGVFTLIPGYGSLARRLNLLTIYYGP